MFVYFMNTTWADRRYSLNRRLVSIMPSFVVNVNNFVSLVFLRRMYSVELISNSNDPPSNVIFRRFCLVSLILERIRVCVCVCVYATHLRCMLYLQRRWRLTSFLLVASFIAHFQ